MLAARMAAVHMATMTFARRLAHVDHILQQDSGRACLQQAGADLRGAVEGVKALQEGRGTAGDSAACDGKRRWAGHRRGSVTSSDRDRGAWKSGASPMKSVQVT
jgi:hypothetical protein